ncbi:MAG: ATP synthase F1 subunit delta [Solobacterium sp.]|nr:ATP synthase F1 subunit delta [Erysipelotrichaceae bacterium]MCI6700551.1 ATP synthase F1 subunit delta [Solobacterium sp.]MDD5842140.1 ATP synthase F1 subunit delta [Solobacterium sp.]MDD6122543.1 ATP synthase F1 subunit delta [Solobacterium sp.]MDD6497777.1 ATP synthase F1 subunit delta [Solobacterium sp.]
MSLVAKRYSEAFFSLALDKNKVSEYKEDLKLVLDTFKGVDSIDLFFASEKITKQEKKDLIEKSFNEKISVDAKNLLKLLVDKGRMGYITEIAEDYFHLANENLNICEGLIESVRPIDETRIKELETLLAKNGQTVVLKQKINKSLISGFRITLNNEVIDGSMKSKIDQMQDLLSRKVK